jgi:hypothetical protein
MKPITNDLLPAIQIIKLEPGSPNSNQLQVGDIVIKIDGERITNTTSAVWALKRDAQSHQVIFIRDGNRTQATMRAIDVSRQEFNRQIELIRSVCNQYSGLGSFQPVCNPTWGNFYK